MTLDRRLHTVLSALVLAGSVVITVISGYLGAMTAAAWGAVSRGRSRTVLLGEPTHRFLVAVPAHDEEQLLRRTLRSLKGSAYPSTHVRIHVVADNCSDGTAAVARSEGAEVHERHEPDHPGKGPALMWLLRRLWAREEPHDAVVVVDADSVVDANFLRVMDAHLARGEKVIQGHYAAEDPDASWTVGIRYAALAARHYLRPLARTSWGGSAGLHGNGMAFAADVLRSHAWASHQTEDIDLEARLLLAGQRVTFAPDARVDAEMPVDMEQAASQHERWERGRVAVARHYVPRLLRAATTKRASAHRMRLADAAMDHLVPPLSALVAVTAAASAGALALRSWRATPANRTALGLAAGAGVLQATYVASALRMVDAPPSVWRSLLHTPDYVIRRLPTWTRLSRPGTDDWVRTARNVHPLERRSA
jgi:GT2 family glycosyltransferase